MVVLHLMELVSIFGMLCCQGYAMSVDDFGLKPDL